MKKAIILSVLAGMFLFSCSLDEIEDKVTPLIPDFEVTVTGESPDAILTIENLSMGADTYKWTFSEGASDSTSNAETPSEIKVEKAGEFSITLVAENGQEEKELTKTVNIEGHTAIDVYTDLEFALTGDDENYGRLFSFETAQMYFDNEIDETNGSLIHLAFSSLSGVMYHFDCPTDEDYDIPNATETKIINWEEEPSISLEEFDAMTDDRLLSVLTIEHEGGSFGNSTVPHTVLFEISNGRKGVIKTKDIDNGRIIVDIKVQRY